MTGSKRRVVIGLLGTTLDAHKPDSPERWERWRPTVALGMHEDLLVDRLELIYPAKYAPLAAWTRADLERVSPETEVREHVLEFDNAWDFEKVYQALHGFARDYPFDLEREEYLVNITTGTHVAQICLFLLTETRHLPGRLLQLSPPRRRGSGKPGFYQLIDLDLSRFDRLASRFEERAESLEFLKSGIATRNPDFNRLIERIELVAVRSKEPVLLTGPTGAGKSRLAGRIYELKKSRRQLEGRFVEVNCATLRGDAAMSTLFGHVRGAFTGASSDRPGLLLAADGGLLFLDEIGELGLDEQAMLLRSVEEKRFLPVGSDEESASDFQLLAGTNRDLHASVERGEFREDLLARINLWTFELPGLAERPEDIEPNLDYELDAHTRASGKRVHLNREARETFLDFATSPQALWTANFRDLNAAVKRLATLADGGRITLALVREEIARLEGLWARSREPAGDTALPLAEALLGGELAEHDRFDLVQLEDVLRACRESRTLSEAGRELFRASRARKAKPNDADRLRKYLARFGLDWQGLAL